MFLPGKATFTNSVWLEPQWRQMVGHCWTHRSPLLLPLGSLRLAPPFSPLSLLLSFLLPWLSLWLSVDGPLSHFQPVTLRQPQRSPLTSNYSLLASPGILVKSQSFHWLNDPSGNHPLMPISDWGIKLLRFCYVQGPKLSKGWCANMDKKWTEGQLLMPQPHAALCQSGAVQGDALCTVKEAKTVQ